MRSNTRSITAESCEVLENSNPKRNRDHLAENNGNCEPSSQSLMFLYRQISQSASVPPQPTLPPPIKVGNNDKEVVYSQPSLSDQDYEQNKAAEDNGPRAYFAFH
jgi:hypothetical protein